jgi:type II secretory ATPase GspE/PulE/Tfp pilus assembly ATPase PilB-like protein
MNKRSLLSTQWCKVHGVALLSEVPPYRIAVSDESDILLLDKIRMELDADIVFQQMDVAGIRRLQSENLAAEDPTTLENALSENIGSEVSSWESEPIVNLVESLLDDALEKKATDIHLEPDGGHLRVRLRQDGLLNEYRTLPLWTCEPVLVRLKILSEIDITDRRIPHDGSFSFCGCRHNANVRVSTLPVQGGEKCVLRLLPIAETQSFGKETKNDFKGLDSLKLSKAHLLFLRQVFNSPQGIFLVTGPTGSGKTTTLHAGLQEILHKQVNVTTIEDPVEYPLEGAAQVQVNEKCGCTFAVALRAILRQDPDVIMVGEIRDKETAQIALRAAQTGHLVVSTLHTNSAKAGFTRLEDLGVSRTALQESLLGIMAQRLLRCRTAQGIPYSGRRAVIEILQPDGNYVDGTLYENAKRLVQANITDMDEIERVLGNLHH